MKKSIKIFLTALSLFTINICGISGYYAANLPDSYIVPEGEKLELTTVFSINAVTKENLPAVSQNTADVRKASLKLFGVFPVKNVDIKTADTVMLVPGGEPFGIKLLMEGVMVVDTGDVATVSGTFSPAKECGLKKGDIILSADGVEVTSNAEISEILAESEGESVEISYSRNDKIRETQLTPVYSLADSEYKAGLWVRDSTAGIGTVTFYEPSTCRFGGLGHPVCDSDTGEIIPISSGETAEVSINKVVRGREGSPGELHGCFSSKLSNGIIYNNNEYGVFGEMFDIKSSAKAIPMGLKQDIKKGHAVILTTTDESGPEEYDIEIEEIRYNSDDTKNMTIRVTDKELLEKTGGIVQGMSGSPIIQNGKLVGAVTHVLVNEPDKGFGIFCENMYETGIAE